MSELRNTEGNRANERERLEAEKMAWEAERSDLITRVRELEQEVSRVKRIRELEQEVLRLHDLLQSERATMIAEFEAGAAELEAERERVDKWRGLAERHRERTKTLETENRKLVGFYEGSRGMRLAERIVRKARRVRGRWRS